MHGFLSIIGSDINLLDRYALIKSINLSGTLQTQSISSENYISAVSFHNSCPLSGPHHFETPELLILFAGDLVNQKSIPWSEISSKISKSSFDWLSDLRGTFAFAVINKKKKLIHIISDQRAQIPIYYGHLNKSFIFSTDISTFTILKSVPNFNEEWLYEFMFFNIPIHRTTFLQNVYRLEPGSILTFDLVSEKIRVDQYSEKLRCPSKLMKGKTALDKCVETFNKVVPKYYDEKMINLVGITGGFDSRTLLALAPENVSIKTYTYGVSGSGDLKEVSAFKKLIDFNHEEILFDDNFVKSLPELIYDTVRLSGGSQPVNRSTLQYVYRNLYDNNRKTPVIISGISGDHFFRGHGNVPAIISNGMEKFFQTGTAQTKTESYQKMFGDKFVLFQKHVENCLQNIISLYGKPIDPETHLSYLTYEIGPKYFGGEASLANNYVIFRAPYWDIDIIRLAYETEFSTLSFSRFLSGKKDSYRENLMQSIVLNETHFRKIPIKGIPLFFHASGNKKLYNIGRLIFRGYPGLKNYFRTTSSPPLEDWNNWFKHVLNNEFDKLLNEKSLIGEYIEGEYINLIKKSNDTHWLGKLATTEIILNLIKNKWNIIK